MKIDGIIFDMDGVLVDVSKSYRFAIKKTVDYLLGKKGIDSKASQKDIKTLKEIPGFNNDWDLSYELIRMLEMGISRIDFSEKVKIVTGQMRKTQKYLLIKNIFQSYYLGEKIFSELYRKSPPVGYLSGLINQELLLIKINVIRKLNSNYKLGVATSRPRFEALYALRNFQITPKYIQEKFIVAQEDVLREKPSPDSLLEAKIRMKVLNPIYIGDSINDCFAANNAGMKCIFVGKKKLGDFQINNVNQIQETIT